MASKFYAFKAFCKKMKFGKTKGWEVIKDQEVEAFKIGNRTFVTKASVESYLRKAIERGRV